MSQNQSPGGAPKDPGKHKGAVVGGLGILGIGLLKAKGLWLVALKLLGSLKFIYFFKSFLSMFLVIGLYTMRWGFVYALIVVGLIFIHEMGHFIWMKGLKLGPKMPIFVPFIGAYTAMEQLPPEQSMRAWVSLAGPLVGGVTSVAMFYYGFMNDIQLLMAAGNTGVMLNLFQLIPAKPFDGGFVLFAISKWFLIPGTGAIFALAALFGSVFMFIIGLLAMYMTWKAFTMPKEAGGTIMGQKPPSLPEKVLIGVAYFGLLGCLAYVYYLGNSELMTLVKPRL